MENGNVAYSNSNTKIKYDSAEYSEKCYYMYIYAIIHSILSIAKSNVGEARTESWRRKFFEHAVSLCRLDVNLI